MTIRARLTLWYAGVLCASLLLCSGLLYHEWVVEPRRGKHGHERESGGVAEMLTEAFLWCWIPAGIFGLAGGWWMIRKALAPVSALSEAAERINENHLDVQLPRSGNRDELDRMTEVFNRMTARLGDSFQRIREFTLRASHELKTPLTVMRAGVETTLRDEPLGEAQREALMGELDEIERLTKIVDSLTLLTKADAGLITIKHEPVALEELVQDACADAQALAPRDMRVRVEICDAITLRGDRHRLRQLLLILTDNAVKYNQPQGEVTLALRRTDDGAEVIVRNTGPAIPVEVQPRLFDPFFRGDAAHSDAVEGSGLGLTIARWIVTAHGGSITLVSRPGELITATVRLPHAS